MSRYHLKRQSGFGARCSVALLCSMAGVQIEAAPAPTSSQWVPLDPELHRQADRASIHRQGPWVQFTQSWGDLEGGKPGADAIVERMAVNCLTGAYGATEYPSTDDKTGKRVVKHNTFDEIEHAEAFDARLVLSNNSTALGRALVEFACTCADGTAAQEPAQSELQSTYDRYMAEPLSKVEYHLRFLRVDSEQIAKDAISQLNAGKSFETVFDELASSFDAATFPHGDLGPHLETEFPIEEVRRYRQLKVGEFSRTPHKGVYGWEVEKLESTRTIPAPSLASMLPRLRPYLLLAHRCQWGE
jgi:hypothetical protein